MYTLAILIISLSASVKLLRHNGQDFILKVAVLTPAYI